MRKEANATVWVARASGVVLGLAAAVVVAAEGGPAARPFKIFDGKPKTIVLWTGGHWGIEQLTAHVKRMPGAEQITCVHGKAPVTGRKFPIDDGDALRTWPRALPVAADDLPDYCPRAKLNAPNPVIYVVMSGALRAKGFPPEPNACTPAQAIQRCVELMKVAVERTAAKGVDWVMLSTMFHNPNPAWPGSVGWTRSKELIEAFNRTDAGKRHPAVDAYTPMASCYPLHLSADAFHTNDYGRHVLAHLWLSALCAWDGIEVPAWSKELVEEARKRGSRGRDAIRDIAAREIALPPAGTGKALEVTWGCDGPDKDFAGSFYRCEQYFAGRGGSNGRGQFYPMPGAQVTQELDRWKLTWPLPADAPAARTDEIRYREPTAAGNPNARDSFVHGHHYFIKISSKTGQWALSMPVRLGVAKDAAAAKPDQKEAAR